MQFVSSALADLIVETLDANDLELPEVIVGIANSGIPIANNVALELGAELAVIVPKKHLWEPERSGKESGYLLSNFAEVKGKSAVLIDDVITTGKTTEDTLQLLEKLGATPQMAAVILDKAGVDELESVPVKSLLSASVL